jgi:hypothetical protein
MVVVLRRLKGILSEIFQWKRIKNSITLKEGNVIEGFNRRHICGQRAISLRLVGFLHLPAGTFGMFIGRRFPRSIVSSGGQLCCDDNGTGVRGERIDRVIQLCHV